MASPYVQQSSSGQSSPESVRATSSPSRELPDRARPRSYIPSTRPLFRNFSCQHVLELVPRCNSKHRCSKLKREKKRAENRAGALEKRLKDLQVEHEKLSQDYEDLQLAHGEEVTRLQARIALLERHVCPCVDIEAESRDGHQLLRELWRFLLKLKLHQYKDCVCTSVAEGKQCSHLSIQSGLMRCGFYVSHAEALNLVREIAAIGYF